MQSQGNSRSYAGFGTAVVGIILVFIGIYSFVYSVERNSLSSVVEYPYRELGLPLIILGVVLILVGAILTTVVDYSFTKLSSSQQYEYSSPTQEYQSTPVDSPIVKAARDLGIDTTDKTEEELKKEIADKMNTL